LITLPLYHASHLPQYDSSHSPTLTGSIQDRVGRETCKTNPKMTNFNSQV